MRLLGVIGLAWKNLLIFKMNRLYILFISVFFFINCSNQPKSDLITTTTYSNFSNNESYKAAMDSARIRIAKQRGESIDSLYKVTRQTSINIDIVDTITFDTLINKKETYYVGHSISKNPFILNSNNDTIYKNSNWALDVEQIDFNNDGNKDILLLYLSNTPNTYDLVMFDDETNSFKNVKDFFLYTKPTRIKNSKYYYSYHKSGCADLNWGSDLFYIKDFESVRLGNISGIGCERETKNGIYVYKVSPEKDSFILIESYTREAGYYGDKWDFIEKYWAKNYTDFL